MNETKPISTYKQSLRERILHTAMLAFAERGIRAVRMDDITAKMGISKRTLYEVYTNKEDMLFEGIRQFQAERHRELMARTEHCQNVMEILVEVYRMQVAELGHVNPLFYSDLAKYPRLLKFLEDDRMVRRKDAYDFLARGVADGYFRQDLDYTVIGHMLDAISSYMFANELYHTYSVEKLFSNVFFIMLRGMCTMKGLQELDRLECAGAG